ncbi:MAG: MlaD family protein [Flectobacillus sp.]|nr:MlaD family protein [Flectobacillus sp.]
MKISKEAKVGILAVVSFALLYLGFNFLKGSDFFSTEKEYYVLYEDVQGMVVSSQVAINGMKVGQVKNVDLIQDQGVKVKVTFVVGKNVELPEGTTAMLASDGLLGGKLIRLELGKSSKILVEKSTIKGTTEQGLSALLQEKALPTLRNADSLMLSLRKVVLSFQNTAAVLNVLLKNSDHTVSSLGTSMNATIADNKSNLAGITANLKTLSGNLVETEKGFKPLLGKFNTMADSLNALKINKALQTTQQSIEGLNRIVASLEAGQGSAGKLLKDDSLYSNLSNTMLNLDKLLIDFRLAPKRYIHLSVFGKKNTAPVVK